MGVLIIAEAGVNHNGDLGRAKDLVYAAKEMGADAVKFQTFKAETLVNKKAEKAEYQKKQTGSGSQYEMLKALEMSVEDHAILAALSQTLGIEFMSTGFDEESIDFLVSLGVQRLKVPSGEITNYPLLKHMAQKNLPLIMSTGMSYLIEVQSALQVILPFYQRKPEELTLLHCTSNYPAAYADVNLSAMKTLSTTFQHPVGYSDHTLGRLVPTLAVSMGATVIEKHFTLDKNLPGPDHQASMMPDEFRLMVEDIRNIPCILGQAIKAPTESELPVRDLVRRSVALNKPIKKGSRLTSQDLILLRPGTGILPSELEQLIGCELICDLEAGTTLAWEHVN